MAQRLWFHRFRKVLAILVLVGSLAGVSVSWAQVGYTPMPFTPFTYSQTGAFMIPGCTPSDPLCLNMISH